MENAKTNTPVRTIPDDYVPGGEAKYWCIPEGLNAGKTLFYYDLALGDGSPQQTILFVHGNPESSYTYRETVRHLEAAQTPLRIIAVDHIGFGLSDQADFEMVDMHHAANLAQFVAALDLTDITLVIHDWGGPIGTGAFLDQPERVTRLMLMNTTVFPMPAEGPTYTKFPIPLLMPWTYLGHIVPDYLWRWVPPMVMTSPGNVWGFVAHMGRFLLRAAAGRLTEKERLYREMFSSTANARASRRHVKQTGVWGHGYRYHDKRHGVQDNHEFYRRIQQELIPSWAARAIPAAAVFGLWDPCAKAQVRAQWRRALPQIEGHEKCFAGVGHFVEEYRAEDIAQSILNFSDRSADS